MYLEGGRRLVDDLGGLLEGPGGALLSLGGDHLGAGFSGGLGLGCHGALQLHREADVLAARRRRHDSGIRGGGQRSPWGGGQVEAGQGGRGVSARRRRREFGTKEKEVT